MITDEPLRPAVWAEAEAPPPPPRAPEPEPALAPAPIAGPDEVLLYRDGEPVEVIARAQAEAAGLTVLDVGSDWVPALFRSTPELSHHYEPVFRELANGRFDESAEGRLAARERYLEPHGIPPSLALLATRFAALAQRRCRETLDLRPLQEFQGAKWDEGGPPVLPERVVTALQARLACEGHLRGAPSGLLDQETRRALEEFERRNRIYARGSLEGETLEALRKEPLELERLALLRVLSERAILDLGVIEDGSARGAAPAPESSHLEGRGTAGAASVEDAPDVVGPIGQRLLTSLGLTSVEGVQRFYRRLEGALERPHYALAVDAVELPRYYAGEMDLWVEIDRGDLYYEFPFDAQGKPLGFEIERGPTLTLFADDGFSVRPLVQYPTTIGGWRVRRVNGSVFWQYKESTVGTRAWRRIVTAPVWLPPASTPSETLVATFQRTSDGSEFRELNQNLIGPSFASAYGLVAAYHQRVMQREGNELELGRDDGMRTHGSSDYTSIWRTVSSGCHRLHNHQAIRLLNFVLAHRAHRRLGHLPVSYQLNVTTTGFQDRIDIKLTGYEFRLQHPLEVQVLPGRIRGKLKHALHKRFPTADDASAWPTILLTPRAPHRAARAEERKESKGDEVDDEGQDGSEPLPEVQDDQDPAPDEGEEGEPPAQADVEALAPE